MPGRPLRRLGEAELRSWRPACSCRASDPWWQSWAMRHTRHRMQGLAKGRQAWRTAQTFDPALGGPARLGGRPAVFEHHTRSVIIGAGCMCPCCILCAAHWAPAAAAGAPLCWECVTASLKGSARSVRMPGGGGGRSQPQAFSLGWDASLYSSGTILAPDAGLQRVYLTDPLPSRGWIGIILARGVAQYKICQIHQGTTSEHLRWCRGSC